uniref:Saposin B-type domain-containing protein n=1 Tax=Bursaphelenchus xylophilus TaxID=6326 RepID=A0A1I7RW38_BURXY
MKTTLFVALGLLLVVGAQEHGELESPSSAQLLKPKPEQCAGCVEAFDLLNTLVGDIRKINEREFKEHTSMACRILKGGGDHKYGDVCKALNKNSKYIFNYLKNVAHGISPEANCWIFLRCDKPEEMDMAHPETLAYRRALDSTPLAYTQALAN